MLSGHLRRYDINHHGSQCSQESSDSDLERQNSSRIQTKSNRAYYNYTCWKFRDTVQADFSGLGSLGERRQKLIEHFRTSVTVFEDLEQLVFEAPDETRKISILIIDYVQANQSRMFTMTNWIKSTNWEPITGGLFSNCNFLNYLDYVESPSKSCYKLPIFCEGGLNNQGHIAEKSNQKVCIVFFSSRLLNFFPPYDRLSSKEVGRQRTSRNTGSVESPPTTSCYLRNHKSANATWRRALACLVIFSDRQHMFRSWPVQMLGERARVREANSGLYQFSFINSFQERQKHRCLKKDT
jgi:hypothetical protein